MTDKIEYLQQLGLIDIDKDIRGGQPVIKDTRIPVSQIIAEVSDGYSIRQIAEDMDIPLQRLIDLFGVLAQSFDQRYEIKLNAYD